MTDKQHTADELRRVTEYVERLRKLILEDTGVNQQFLLDAVSMLRTGADAMDALAKAEARVKVLEGLFSERELKRAENRMVYSIPAMDEGAQAMRDMEAAQANRRTPGTIEVCKKCHATLAQFKKYPCAKRGRDCPLKQVTNENSQAP